MDSHAKTTGSMADIPMADILFRARIAQKVWADASYKDRSACLARAEAYLANNGEKISEIIHQDTGKLKLDAMATEVLPAAMAIRYYRKQGKRFLSPRPIRCGNLLLFNKKSRIVYAPFGVIGIISPWNYPFSIPFSEIVMALLAGNAVVLKVASSTPTVGRVLEQIFAAADLPEGLFTHVTLAGKDAGPAFIASGVDKLFFTGSTEVGRQLMALAAPRLLPLVLELGGADAAIIRQDADMDRAVWGMIWAGFSNAGQSCGGIQRVLVHHTVYDEFLRKLCAAVESLKTAAQMDCDLGPMISLRQKAAVRDQVAASVAAGAVIAAKSPGVDLEDDSLFAPAMVLTEVTETMPVMAEEVFGPVVALMKVENDEEALRIANACPYALTGSVWSKDRRQARKLAARINAGAVMINDHLMSHGLAETPWGGFGDSGFGRTHGKDGFREMLKTKVVVDEILPGIKRNLWWQPYSENVYQGIRSIFDLAAGTSFFCRLKAIPGVIKIFFRYWKG
ncbi:aldehyde dehydrogenase family protein [Desulfosarcina sp. OttesenSCG-928-A07]|nr:aldehyde dehydrogenase family protein [Desulfosarcina sp. OttesenSCG-928-G17]MDL2330040.1 aldehyde dehydrogenase family protein [Desulfosarcina sp. OttesenSCG-928-A07]